MATIVDFGLAKLSLATRVTRTGSTLGTLPYMSPEQLQGLPSDHRTDIWSLGVTLFESLTGKLPFRGDHDAALMYSIINTAPANLQADLPEAPVQLSYILARALEKEPGDRYQSTSDLAIDLRRVRRDSSRVSMGGVRLADNGEPGSALRGRKLRFARWIVPAVVSLALDWLESAYRLRDPELVFLNVSHVGDPLRAEPRFQVLLKRIGRPSTVSTGVTSSPGYSGAASASGRRGE